MSLTKVSYSMIQGAVANVLDFGAKGDGTTDDTAAIQAAINAAGCVFLPEGTYKISAALQLKSKTKLMGAGWTSVIKVDAAAATRFIPILVNVTAGTEGIMISDLAVDGSGKGQLDAGLIQINASRGFVVERVKVYNGGTPAEASPSGVNGITASAGSLGGIGSTGVIRDCYIEATTKAGINISTEAYGVLVEGNRVLNCTGNGVTPGIQVAGGLNTRIIGNHVSGCQGSGILIGTTGGVGTYRYPLWTIVTNNHVHDNGQGTADGHGIRVQNAAGQTTNVYGYINISDNIVYGTGSNTSYFVYGIYFENLDNIVCDNNIVHLNNGIGIAVQNCRQVQISGGIIENNNVVNNAQGSGVFVGTSGSSVTQRLAILNVQFRNDTGQHQKYPMLFDSSIAADSVEEFQFLDNQSTGHETRDFPLTILPKKTDFRHTFDYQTTGGSYTNAAFFDMFDNSAFRMRITVVGKQSDASNRNAYDRTALVYRDGGGATIQGAVADSFSPIESAAAWDATVQVTSNTATVAVLGAAATTVDWRITTEITSI